MGKKSKQLKRNKNILYTGFGDKGTTTLFDCKQSRISKSANLIEALGSIDELNAFLGVVKVSADKEKVTLIINKKNVSLLSLIEEIQQTLFIIQAEIGGSKITVLKKDLNKIEKIISTIADILPPIKSFTISGGSALSAELDYSRTLARRAERRVTAVMEEGSRKMGVITISYLNRLSSVLFAMSRYSNYSLSVKEDHPQYNKKK